MRDPLARVEKGYPIGRPCQTDGGIGGRNMEPVGAERSSAVRDVVAGFAAGVGAPSLAVFLPDLGFIAIPVWLACLVVGMYLMERSEGRRWNGPNVRMTRTGASAIRICG